MSDHAVAHLDEIEEVNDRRCPFRRVRLHFGITSFAVNAWTGHDAGDRIINEHDESDEESQEELYLVQRGRATFELDGERVDAPPARWSSQGPASSGRPSRRRRAPPSSRSAGRRGRRTSPAGWELWAPLAPLYDSGKYAEAADRGRELIETYPDYPDVPTTWPAVRASRTVRTKQSSISGARSRVRRGCARWLPKTPTWTRSAISPRSRIWWGSRRLPG